ncbi:hypothetical protein V8E54_007899 [Elaphomyces granulatus]
MSALEIQKQLLLLGSQAAQVFERKAFKLAVWVGVFGPFSTQAQQCIWKGNHVQLVIFYDPAYSENEILEWYASNGEDDLWLDPDGFELERAWNRRVDILRIYKGTLQGNLRSEEAIMAILHAQTIYGNFNHPVLQHLRSSYIEKAQECEEKLEDSQDLALRAIQSEDSSTEYQLECIHQIAKILSDGNEDDPLCYALLRRVKRMVNDMAKKGDGKLTKKSLKDLYFRLIQYESQAWSITEDATIAENMRAEWKRSVVEPEGDIMG